MIIEKQKAERRQKHNEALNEYQRWLETFHENMNERVTEKKDSLGVFLFATQKGFFPGI
jgi:hypothetical protein